MTWPPAGSTFPWVIGGQPGYDPWLHLSTCEGVTLTWHEEGPWGLSDFETRTISLRRGLSQAELRSTLAHELLHLERGPVMGPSDAGPGLLEESLVEQTAALRLIPAFVLDELPELIEDHGAAAAAAFLGIDVGMVEEVAAAVARVRPTSASLEVVR